MKILMLKTLHNPLIISLLSLIGLGLFASSAQANEDNCQMPEIKIWHKATFATRGDSLIVQGQMIRLIGVVAPEIEKKSKLLQPAQPLSVESQTFLNKLLANNEMEVGLVYDKRIRDTAGRTLAHVFLRDGRNVTTEVLAAGMGVAASNPVNIRFADCYFAAEQKARDNGLALWGLSDPTSEFNYPIAESSKLNPEDIGYRIIRGKVVLVEKSSTNIIINMDTTGIRIPLKAWNNFDYSAIENLMGKVIEVRGYGFQYRRAMFVSIESPNDINLLRTALN